MCKKRATDFQNIGFKIFSKFLKFNFILSLVTAAAELSRLTCLCSLHVFLYNLHGAVYFWLLTVGYNMPKYCCL